MRSRHRFVSLATLAVFALNASPASAGVGVEVYAGPRPAEASAPMATLAKELAALGDKFGGGARESLHYVRLPAILDRTLTPSAIADQFVLGKTRWGRGNCEEAVQLLRVGKFYAQENAALAVQIDNFDELRFDGLLYLALCQRALKDEVGARQTLVEAYRTYPDRTATLAKHTTDGVQLWNDVRKDQAKAARGTLRVALTNPKAQIFVNEVARGKDGRYAGELLPGTYRVLVVEGKTAYRFDVDVEANATRTLDIAWDAQPYLTLSDVWFGFAAPVSELTDALERSFIGAVMSMFDGKENTVYAVSVVRRGLHWYLTGKVYDQAGTHLVRSGMIELGKSDAERIRAFAKFLHGGERASAILPLVGAAPTSEVEVEDHARSRSTAKPDLLFTWVTAGIAASFFATGGWALYMDGKPNCFWSDVCGQPYDSALVGYVGLGAGGVMAGLSIYWYTSERARVRSASRPSASIVPLRGGAMAGVGWAF